MVETDSGYFADAVRVYILEPTLRPSDPAVNGNKAQLATECNKKENSLDMRDKLLAAGFAPVEIALISLDNYMELLDSFEVTRSRTHHEFVVFNLCDGIEQDGYPGVTILKELERRRFPYTGSDSNFYAITTSKVDMKNKLLEHNIPTSPFVCVNDANLDAAVMEAERVLGYPMILKPSVSYASIGISDRSVVHNKQELRNHFLAEKEIKEQANRMRRNCGAGGLDSAAVPGEGGQDAGDGEKNAEDGAFFVEKFLAGREFTALCTGGGHARTGSGGSEKGPPIEVKVYPAVERVFDSRLGVFERMLAFDRYWTGYDLQGGRPVDAEQLYQYAAAPTEWQENLMNVARAAYEAVGGNGYGRVDLRTASMDSPDPLVLEVNANCGVSFEPGTSSCAEIINISKTPQLDLVTALVRYAFERIGRHLPMPRRRTNGEVSFEQPPQN